MKKAAILLSFIFLLAAAFSAPAQAFTPSGFEIAARNALLVNLDTGERLFEKAADERIYPASTTKLMTALVTIDHVPDLNTTVTADGDVIDLLLGTDSSLAGIKDGEELTVAQLLHYLLISSGNDAAMILADYVGGGAIVNFVGMMNEKAAALGMTGTKFANPHGLHSPEHYTTANDLGILTREALKNDLIREIISLPRYTMPPTNQNEERLLVNTNYLLNVNSPYYYSFATGGKTGYTDPAGRCLISTADKDGIHYLCIVMGCPVEEGENAVRHEFIDAKNLFEWAYNSFAYKSIVDVNEPVSGMDVALSWEKDYIQLYPEKTITALLPKEADKSSLIYEPSLAAESVDAPVEKGQTLGSAKIYYAGELVGEVGLVAGEDVHRSLLLFLWKQAKLLAASKWMMMILLVLAVGILLMILISVIRRRKRRRAKRLKLYKRL